MKILFCSDPLDGRKPDAAYAAEVSAALDLGLEYSLIDYEALVDDNNPARAVRKVAAQTEPESGLYR